MKHISTLLIGLTLAGCASTQSTNTPASNRLGKITDKQTIVTQSQHNPLPVNVGVGFGGHGWGVNLGLGQLFGLLQSSSKTLYQYTIKVAPNESILLQNDSNFETGTCVTVWERAGDSSFPQIQTSAACPQL
ncbi:MAG: hypothetical protein ACRCV6_06080 [Formosimonas sp.]